MRDMRRQSIDLINELDQYEVRSGQSSVRAGLEDAVEMVMVEERQNFITDIQMRVLSARNKTEQYLALLE